MTCPASARTDDMRISSNVGVDGHVSLGSSIASLRANIPEIFVPTDLVISSSLPGKVDQFCLSLPDQFYLSPDT